MADPVDDTSTKWLSGVTGFSLIDIPQVAEDCLGDRGQRVDLVGRQQADEVLTDGCNMARSCCFDSPQPVVGDHDDGAARVRNALFPGDKPALLHPGDVVRQAALGPQHARRQLVQPHAVPDGVGQVRQHVIVRLGESGVACQISGKLKVESATHSPVADPGAVFGVGEPSGIVHDSTVSDS